MSLTRVDERQVWARVVNSAGQETTMIDNIMGVSFSRVLDGVGSFSIQVSGTDKHALDVLTVETKVNLYIFENNSKRLLGSGIIRKIRANDNSSAFTVSITGPDELDDLRRKSILLGLSYDDETISDIINGTGSLQGLLDFVQGWAASISVTGNHYARFDGINILKAIRELVEAKGTHFRLSTTTQTIEIGDFGDWNGLTLVQAPINSPELDSNDDVGIIESISINETSDGTVDFIIPLGASSGGDISLTLEESTRISPYSIQSDTYNGRTYYYLGTSTKTLSQVFADNTITVETKVFDQIQILSNSAEDILAASNALYDIASAYLDRKSSTLIEYDVGVKKLRSNVLPGDKIRMMYKGFIKDKNSTALLPPRDINDEFWILSVSESVGQEGLSTSLKLGTVDRAIQDEADIVIGELEKARVRNLSVKPYPSVLSYIYVRKLDYDNIPSVPIRITNRILRIRQVTLRVTTRHFLSDIESIGLTSSAHRHTLFEVETDSGATGNYKYVKFYNESGGIHRFRLEEVNDPGTSYTTTWEKDDDPYWGGGGHIHGVGYGLNEDSLYPNNILVSINGVDRTSALGGPFGSAVAKTTFELDITPYILGESTLYKTHTIDFQAVLGRGEIEVQVEVYADNQTVGIS